MRQKRLTPIEQAIRNLDDQITVLQQARKVLGLIQQEQANQTAARKPKPKLVDVPNAG